MAAPTDRLFTLLFRNLAIGVVVAVGTVGGLVATDAQGLGSLLLADDDPVIAVLLLTFGFIITLGSAAMGAAIMALPRDPGSGPGRHRPVLVRPIPVPAAASPSGSGRAVRPR